MGLLLPMACTVALPARADPTVDECIASNRQAQTDRRYGKLRAAREELLSCAATACPKMVRDDCIKQMADVDRATPTIVFQVESQDDRDLVDVDVTMDGANVTSKLDGRALSVDVGDHEFTFSAHGYTPVTRHFVLVEGQKDRREKITLTSAAPVAPPPAPPAPPPVEPPPITTTTPLLAPRVAPPPVTAPTTFVPFVDTASIDARRSRRSTGVTFTVLSALSFGGTIAFAALGASQNSTIKNGGFATASDIADADSAGQAYNIGLGVSLAAGIVLACVGIPLWLLNLGDGKPTSVALRW